MRLLVVVLGLVAGCSVVKPRPPTRVDDPTQAPAGSAQQLGATSRFGAVPAPDAPPVDAAVDAVPPRD